MAKRVRLGSVFVVGVFALFLFGFSCLAWADLPDIGPGETCISVVQRSGGVFLIAFDHAGEAEGDDDDGDEGEGDDDEAEAEDDDGERTLTIIEIRLPDSPDPSGGIGLSPLIGRVLAEFETGSPECGSPQVHKEQDSGEESREWVDWIVPDALCFSVRSDDEWNEPQLIPFDGRTVEKVREAIRVQVLGLN